MITPRPWQVKPIEHLVRVLSRSRGAIDASDVGTGKTYVALLTAKKLRYPVGIVCPKALVLVWKEACAAAGVTPIFIVSYDKAVKGFEYGKWVNSKLYSWTYPKPHILIADEAHRLRHHKTRTCRIFEAGADWGAQFKLLAISATLAENPMHFKALGRWMDMFPRQGFWAWCTQYGVVREGFGFSFTTHPEYRRDSLLRLHKLLFPFKGVRVRVEEIPDFPDQVIEFIPVEVSPSAMKLVEKQIKALHEKAKEDQRIPVVDLLRARQESELLKVESLIEQASDLVEDGNSVAIFLEFSATIEAVAEGLKALTPAVLVGETSDEDRQSLVAQFQRNEKHIIILQSRVGGVGLSLHDLSGRPRVALISPSYSATTFKQVLGRIRRAGGRSAAVQRIVYLPSSVESRVIHAVKNKIKNIDLLHDGDLSWFPQNEENK